MTLLYTATVGTLLWWYATGTVDTRFTMGLGGPWIYGGVLAFVLAMAVRGVNRRLAAATSRITPDPPRFPVLRSIAIAILVALPLLIAIAVAFELIRVGDSGSSVLFFGAVMAVTALPVAIVVGALGRRYRSAFVDPPHGPPPSPSASDVTAALAPLLVPLAAMILLRNVSAGAWWDARADGPPRAGIMYYTLLPLMLPAAILVAWGLDRLDGSRGAGAAGVFALVALIALAAATWWMPQFLLECMSSSKPSHSHGFFEGYASGLRFWDPFHTTMPDDPPGSGTAPLLPLTDFVRATALMMLLAAALSAFALRRLGRRVRTLTMPRIGLMLLLQALLTALAMPRLGLVGAPLAAAAALVVAALPVLPPPSRVAEPAELATVQRPVTNG